MPGCVLTKNLVIAVNKFKTDARNVSLVELDLGNMDAAHYAMQLLSAHATGGHSHEPAGWLRQDAGSYGGRHGKDGRPRCR